MRYIISVLLLLQLSLNAKIISSPEIDPTKKSIRIILVNYYSRANTLANTLSKYDNFIQHLKNGQYALYVVNIDDNKYKETLGTIKKHYKDAYRISQKQLNYISSLKQKRKNISSSLNSTPTLNKAKLLYKQKRFKEVINLLEPIYQNIENNNQLNFYLGQAYYKTKNYELALAMYERILITDNSLTRVKLELAQTYLMLNMKKEALVEFNKLLKQKNLPVNVKNNIYKRIKYIKSLEKRHHFSFNIGLNYIYDNNVNNRSSVDSYSIYSSAINSNMTIQTQGEKESDTGRAYQLSGTHSYKIDDSKLLENTIFALHQNYDKFKDKKTQSLSLSSYISKLKTKHKASYGVDVGFVRYNNEKLQKTIGLGMKYQRKLSKTKNMFSMVKVFKKSYFDISNKDKESNNLNFIVGQVTPTKKYGTFNNMLSYSKEKKIRGERTDVNKDIYAVIVSQNYKLSNSLSSNLSLSLKRDSYKLTDVNFLSRRKDKSRDISIGLTKILNKNITLGFSIISSNVNSNQEPFSYEKTSSKVTINYKF